MLHLVCVGGVLVLVLINLRRGPVAATGADSPEDICAPVACKSSPCSTSSRNLKNICLLVSYTASYLKQH